MKKLSLVFTTLVICVCANCVWAIEHFKAFLSIPILLFAFVLVNIVPVIAEKRPLVFRLKVCNGGVVLLGAFLVSLAVSVVCHIVLFLYRGEVVSVRTLVVSAIVATVVLSIVFWNGIIRVYLTSVQLGIKKRVIGALCGFIPIANLIALCDIIRTVSREVAFESEKLALDKVRAQSEVCRTKYPILLVHGVFFRDMTFPNYWGRIPAELKRNGATIFYGDHDSAQSVARSGKELALRIEQIVRTTGCEKVNIIAHSKGGLDSRYAISNELAAEYVASLTTINTPHRGCLFADYLLSKIPRKAQNKIASAYNAAMRRLGDNDPDFMAAVRDLTAARCEELDFEMPDVSGVEYQSVASRLVRAKGGKFPLNFTYRLAKYFDGPNDGLVSVESAKRWKCTVLEPSARRGISHGDVIDLNRENIADFDVREFYVGLVSSLKERGY